MDTSAQVEITEANGKSSYHDLEIFRAWKKGAPGYDWTHAEVDRHTGLTLYCDTAPGYMMGLHFANALCGYGGTGPSTTVTILVEAGFGSHDELAHRIFNEMHVELIK